MLTSFFSTHLVEAGCDEAGRGCLAGPVFAASVILEKSFSHPLLNDSKKLSEKQRNFLRQIIEEKAVSFAVAYATPEEIDQINILNASFLAMHRAIEKLTTRPELLLVDGNRFKPFQNLPYECIVGGDGKFSSIAAASILAKTYRDEYMMDLAAKYPYYEWEKNKGYPTKSHRSAILKWGKTPHHRNTFRILD